MILSYKTLQMERLYQEAMTWINQIAEPTLARDQLRTNQENKTNTEKDTNPLYHWGTK